jgi:16S rRNA (guanine966-N2)-methyltransferase
MKGLRIAGGQWRSKALETPSGKDVTRPTTERTRQRIASMVLSSFSLDLSGISVLDAFAGSGALGFEMLSRGAANCCFIDSSRTAISCIKKNSAAMGAGLRAWSIYGDVFKLVCREGCIKGPFDLVLLDPPYALCTERLEKLLDTLMSSGRLGPHARVVYEHSSKSSGLSLRDANLVKSSSHGIACVDLYVFKDRDDL